MKLVFFDALSGDKEKITKQLPECDIDVVNESIDSENLHHAVDADIVSTFVQSKLPAEFLSQMKQLKYISSRSTGLDHIDVEQARKQNIVISNVPDYGGTTVAEHAFALIMALSRKIFQSYERTEKMDFNREGLTGFDLKGKTIGVVGGGNIGQEVIRIAHGFAMNVLVFDAKPDKQLAADKNFSYTATLDDLLQQSDVVSLHVPYLESTHHLINKENIFNFKSGAILINTARGGLIETDALLVGLEKGILSGAGLDVLEEENDAHDRVEFLSKEGRSEESLLTLLKNHLLVGRNDVIITPHNAFNSEEAVDRILNTTIDNIRGFINNEPINIVK